MYHPCTHYVLIMYSLCTHSWSHLLIMYSLCTHYVLILDLMYSLATHIIILVSSVIHPFMYSFIIGDALVIHR